MTLPRSHPDTVGNNPSPRATTPLYSLLQQCRIFTNSSVYTNNHRVYRHALALTPSLTPRPSINSLAAVCTMVSNEKLCASLAGPFRNIHDENTASNLWFLFFFASIAITPFIRFLVLGYCLYCDLGPSKTDQPVPTPCPRCEYIDEALLPLSPPPPTSESNSISNPKPCREEIEAEDKRRMAVIPSIPRFALCTALAILNLLTMVLLAFAIQSLVYCSPELTSGTRIANRHQNFYAVTSWIVYVFLAGWVLSGILCWAMWARNLWGGEDAAKKWPIRSDLGGITLGGVPLGELAVRYMLIAAYTATAQNIARALWPPQH